ncbi:MAG: hypothetical protein V1709_04515 [Planctomycetota bacterium]
MPSLDKLFAFGETSPSGWGIELNGDLAEPLQIIKICSVFLDVRLLKGYNN